MPHVVLVAPRFLENTNRYVKAFADLPEVTLSVVSGDPESSIPEALRPRVAGHYRVNDALDADELTVAARGIARGVGKIDRLAGALEELQLPMAQVRDALDIEGMRSDVARAFRDKDRMKEVLRAHGLPVAKSRLVTSLDEVKRFAGEVGVPIILKPQAGPFTFSGACASQCPLSLGHATSPSASGWCRLAPRRPSRKLWRGASSWVEWCCGSWAGRPSE